MHQKLSFMLAMLLTFTVYASDNNFKNIQPPLPEKTLPALPDSLVLNEVKNGQKSIWQKIKFFFGFSKDKIIIEQTEKLSAEIIDPYQKRVEVTQEKKLAQQDNLLLITPELSHNQDNDVEQLLNNFSKIIEQNDNISQQQNVPKDISVNAQNNEEIPISPIIAPNTSLETTANIKENLDEQVQEKLIIDITQSAISNLQLKDIVTTDDPLDKSLKPKDSNQSMELIETETIESMTRNNNIDLPIPNYANKIEKETVIIDNVVEALQQNKTNQQSLPIVKQKIYEIETSKVAKEKQIDAKQIKFIDNELQVLVLPNDEIVLGKITKNAAIEQMSLYYYIKKFWQNYENLKQRAQAEKIDEFIKNYQNNFKSSSS